MAHCGYEASAVSDVFASPLKAIGVAINGPKTDGAMAEEIDLTNSRDLSLFLIHTCKRCLMKFIMVKLSLT